MFYRVFQKSLLGTIPMSWITLCNYLCYLETLPVQVDFEVNTCLQILTNPIYIMMMLKIVSRSIAQTCGLWWKVKCSEPAKNRNTFKEHRCGAGLKLFESQVRNWWWAFWRGVSESIFTYLGIRVSQCLYRSFQMITLAEL